MTAVIDKKNWHVDLDAEAIRSMLDQIDPSNDMYDEVERIGGQYFGQIFEDLKNGAYGRNVYDALICVIGLKIKHFQVFGKNL